MHALDAIAVINLQCVIVLQTHALGGAAGDDVVDHMLATLLIHIFFPLVLFDNNLVAPGPNHRKIGSNESRWAVSVGLSPFPAVLVRAEACRYGGQGVYAPSRDLAERPLEF